MSAPVAVVTLKGASAAQFPGPIIVRAPLFNSGSVLMAPIGGAFFLSSIALAYAVIFRGAAPTRGDMIAAAVFGPSALAMGGLGLKLGLAPFYPRRATLTLDRNGFAVDYGGKRGDFAWSNVDQLLAGVTMRDHAFVNSATDSPFRVAGWDCATKGKAHLLPDCFGSSRRLIRLLQEWRDRAVQNERQCED